MTYDPAQKIASLKASLNLEQEYPLKLAEQLPADQGFWKEVEHGEEIRNPLSRVFVGLEGALRTFQKNNDEFLDYGIFMRAFGTLILLQRGTINSKPAGSPERTGAIKKLLGLLSAQKFVKENASELQ